MLNLPQNTEESLKLNYAFFSLSGNKDVATIKEWLSKELLRIQRGNNVQKDDTVFKWQQGALQTLVDLLAYSDRDNAKILIEKLKE